MTEEDYKENTSESKLRDLVHKFYPERLRLGSDEKYLVYVYNYRFFDCFID